MKLVCVRVEGLEGQTAQTRPVQGSVFAAYVELCRKHFIEQIWKSKT